MFIGSTCIDILICFQIIKLVMADNLLSVYMKKIYDEVGSSSDLQPEEGKLTLEKNMHLLKDEVAHVIEEVLFVVVLFWLPQLRLQLRKRRN